MTQEIERTHDSPRSPADEQINPVVRSNPEDGRRKSAKTLKEKMEEEQKKARQKKKIDEFVSGGDDSSGEEKEEKENDKPDGNPDDECLPTEETGESQPLSKERIDLKA